MPEIVARDRHQIRDEAALGVRVENDAVFLHTIAQNYRLVEYAEAVSPMFDARWNPDSIAAFCAGRFGRQSREKKSMAWDTARAMCRSAIDALRESYSPRAGACAGRDGAIQLT
jgi:hypothetical protein